MLGVDLENYPKFARADDTVTYPKTALDIRQELDWMADNFAAQWEAHLDSEGVPPTAAVLVRRRSDMAAIAAALRERGLPVEVVGLGGLLDEPEVRDLVSALRVLVDPLAGTAAARLLTGSRWRRAGKPASRRCSISSSARCASPWR